MKRKRNENRLDTLSDSAEFRDTKPAVLELIDFTSFYEHTEFFESLINVLPLVGKVMLVSTCKKFRRYLFSLDKETSVLGMLYNKEYGNLRKMIAIDALCFWDMKYCNNFPILHTDMVRQMMMRNKSRWLGCLHCVCTCTGTFNYVATGGLVPKPGMMCRECTKYVEMDLSRDETNAKISQYFSWHTLETKDLQIRMCLVRCFINSCLPRNICKREQWYGCNGITSDSTLESNRVAWRDFLKPVLAPVVSCLDDLEKKIKERGCFQRIVLPTSEKKRHDLNESLKIDLVILFVRIVEQHRMIDYALDLLENAKLLQQLINVVRNPKFIPRIFNTKAPEKDPLLGLINAMMQEEIRILELAKLFRYIRRVLR